MTDLAALQGGMLRLIKGRPINTKDSYLARIEGSRELAAIRQIAIWWRTYHVERTCVHTARLMKRLGLLGQAVAEFYAKTAASPFAEEVGRQFASEMSWHGDPLIASMAQFETALLQVRAGDSCRYGIEWDRTGGELPAAEGMLCHVTEVSAEIPGLVCCTHVA